MSTSPQPSLGRPNQGERRTRLPIRALSHPGGRTPGVELPPTWFPIASGGVIVSPVLPGPDADHAALVAAVREMVTSIREAATQAFKTDQHPVLVGGDHSLAMGTIAAAAATHARTAVIWIDAHADFNTMETSPTGNPHGMPLACACGVGDARLTGLFERFVSPRDVVLIAARDIDPGEQELLDAQGIWCVTVAELRELGPRGLVDAIVRRFGDASVHLSFDFDAISSEFFAATGTPVPGGLLPDEAVLLLETLAAAPLDIVSSDWVEFDPRHKTADEAAKLALRLYQAFHGTAL